MTKLSEKQGQALVRLARVTLKTKFSEEITPDDNDILQTLSEPVFQEKHGVFVTLTICGQLRGCIGNLVSNLNIVEGVKRNALSAAFDDYRFPPLVIDELSSLDIEVSVLSDPTQLNFTDAHDLIAKLRPEIDGVVLRQGTASATFLPQVWEQLPNAADFLGHLCQKAGLPSTAWRTGEIDIETYQVQHFQDK